MAVNSFKEDEWQSDVKKSVTVKRLLTYLLDYKKSIVTVLLIMAYCVTVSIINPLFIESAVDDYITVKDFKGLAVLIGIALAVNIIWILLVKLRMHIMAKVTNSAIKTIREELFDHLQKLDFKFFDSRPTGKILSRVISDVNALKGVLEKLVLTLIPDAVMLIAIIVVMLVKDFRLALAAMAGLPILLVSLLTLENLCHKNWKIVRKKSSNVSAFVHEEIAGIRIVKSYNAEGETLDTFDNLISEHKGSFLKAVRINDMYNSFIEISWAVSSFAMYFVGIKVIGIDKLSIGTLLAFGTYISLFWQPIANLGDFYNQLISNIAAAERVFEVMDTPPEIRDGEGVAIMPDIEGSVTFDDVTFSYEDGVKVLKDVSFDIKPGEMIALVGPTGAGKTTVVNLISRFYDAEKGRVLIDGHDVKDVTIESLRNQMGIMTQDNFLFSGTIRENIRYGKLDATDEEIEAAAKTVNAHDFIMKLEKGYDTELAERGSGLSVGQRQLIAFARTILSDPKILILDEATSSIDTKSELMVQAGIAAILKGRTSFVIAHRLSTIRRADRIFVVDDGRIVEEGTHEELLARKGMYYNLSTAQAV
ncbi:MAG: ABC transporter ATP-binding protein [Lachnospiraceae bacterium]|nr:ABC transporter ATP-binding protein [Lachnospiraceae bacterium]MBR5993936.1 ABC transporter ATP-binding protein [Lachnospiraceae bacterium]